MFTLCRTPLAASAVDVSVKARFIHPAEECLVTAAADVLRVFRLRPHQGTKESECGTHKCHS